MSDLQCPATLFIGRHGQTEPVGDGVSADRGELSDEGRRQVHRLVEQVRPRHIAAVYSSRQKQAVESAQLAASDLGVGAVVVDGLQDFSVGELSGVGFDGEVAHWEGDATAGSDLGLGSSGAEDIDSLVQLFAATIGDIADTHRGEAVLVFTHGPAMALAIQRLAVNVGIELAGQRLLPHCVVVEMAIDADGWRLVAWPGANERHSA